MTLRSTFFLLLLALLAGCASAPLPTPPDPASLFADHLFRAEAKPAQASGDVFALSPAMQAYLKREVAQQVRSKGSRQGLLDALYTKSQLQLEYDASITRNAAEAFADRRGNCLSLVLMTAAFAKAMEVPVRFNSVYMDELWSRNGDLHLLSAHVNLSLGRSLMERVGPLRSTEGEMMTIDFLPSEDLRSQRSRVIEEHTVVAMYYNNRAAEALQLGRVDEAYWWVRAAVAQDPRFTSAQNTLGVVYRRAGQQPLAERVLRGVLAQEPSNTQSMSNLILTLDDRGAGTEARQLEAKLREIQPDPPFKYFDLGVAAMKRGEYREAKRLFTREVERFAYYHEFHFWLALANYALGDLEAVNRHLALARDSSTTTQDRERYAAKLNGLRAARLAERRPG